MACQEDQLSSLIAEISTLRNFQEKATYAQELEAIRKELVEFCANAVLADHSKGKELSMTLWQVAYKELLSEMRTLWSQKEKRLDKARKLVNLLNNAIACIKDLVVKLAQRCGIDLSELWANEVVMLADNSVEAKDHVAMANNKETLHFFLNCLGNLYRFCVTFQVPIEGMEWDNSFVLKFFKVAFELKPTCGKVLYKLGLVSDGSNFNIDRVYYFSYALVCTIPSELSEHSLTIILQKYKEYLRNVDGNMDECDMGYFMARFYLLVDTFFFDRNIKDLDIICKGVLLDLRKLCQNELKNLGADFILKFVSLLFFSLSKLQMVSSPNVGMLQIFIITICCEFVDNILINLENYMVQMQIDLWKFNVIYAAKFIEMSQKSGGHSKCLNGLVCNVESNEKKEAVVAVSGEFDAKQAIAKKCPKRYSELRKSRRRKRNPMYTNSDTESSSEQESDDSEDVCYDFTESTEVAKQNTNESKLDLSLSSSMETILNLGKSGGDIVLEHQCARKKYSKIDPNVVINFAIQEPLLPALKLLFDWLGCNPALLLQYNYSNPALICKIMKLLDVLNLDLFNRSLYFEREFIQIPELRADLFKLFELESEIPLPEDIAFKQFHLFNDSQMKLDWNISHSLELTKEEEAIVRLFKLVDFGFGICHDKQYKYYFCSMTRHFIEGVRVKCRRRRNKQRREERFVKHVQRKQASNSRLNEHSSQEYEEPCNQPSSSNDSKSNDAEQINVLAKKSRLMYNLWLQNELKVHEQMLAHEQACEFITPFLVVDTKALVGSMGNVRTLVTAKRFIIIVPTFVINRLDVLKNSSLNARRVIRWLEAEFKRGNCHLRAQRKEETLPVFDPALPRHMDAAEHDVMDIARLCYYIVANRREVGASGFPGRIITYLYGAKLKTDQSTFDFYSLLDSLPARHEHIGTFYKKFKAMKK